MPQVGFADSMEHIEALVKACSPIIWVVTHEEARFTKALRVFIASKLKRELLCWSNFRGIVPAEKELEATAATVPFEGTQNPMEAINAIVKYNGNKGKFDGQIFVMKDMHLVMSNPVPRALRDIYQHLIHNNKTLLIISPVVAHGPGGQHAGIDPILDKLVTIIEYKLPEREGIRTRISATLEAVKTQHKAQGITSKSKLEYTEAEINELASALLGLTEVEIDNAIMTCLTSKKELIAEHLLTQKKQIISRGDVLEYIELRPGFQEIGGNDQLKEYFNRYKDQFTPEAAEFGVDPLRGVLLVGVPGCLAGETPIFDPVDLSNYSVAERYLRGVPFHVVARGFHGEKVVAIAGPPHKYPISQMITFTTEKGGSFTVTPSHRFLGPSGWVYAHEAFEQLQKSEPFLLQSSEDNVPVTQSADALRLKQKAQDFLIDYQQDLRSYDEQPLMAINNVQELAPSLADAHEYIHYDAQSYLQNRDDSQEHALKCNHACQQLDHLSMQDSYDQNDRHKLPQISSETDRLDSVRFREAWQSPIATFPADKAPLLTDVVPRSIEPSDPPMYPQSINGYIRIVKAETAIPAEYYDFHVPIYNNYELAGVWHHNCGKSLAAKAVASEWGLPLLRLDVGRVMTGLVGGSEQKMRLVVNQVESVAPCVTGDTLITTDQGKIPISTLYQKASYPIQASTIDPLSGVTIKTWINKIIRRKAEDKPLLEICTESGKIIRVTKNHKLLVNREGTYIWVEAQYLSTDDNLVESDN